MKRFERGGCGTRLRSCCLSGTLLLSFLADKEGRPRSSSSSAGCLCSSIRNTFLINMNGLASADFCTQIYMIGHIKEKEKERSLWTDLAHLQARAVQLLPQKSGIPFLPRSRAPNSFFFMRLRVPTIGFCIYLRFGSPKDLSLLKLN